jgi:acyl-CoA thioesterase-2
VTTDEERRSVPLLWLLDLHRVDRDLFSAPSPAYTHRPTLFGGQVAAQALRAATLTVDVGHRPHSLHLYFLRPGRPGQDVVCYVDRVRDGRSFTTRNVVVRQDGEAILTMSASFHTAEPSAVEFAQPMADVPVPAAAPAGPPPGGIDASQGAGYVRLENIDLGGEPAGPRGERRSAARSWTRTAEELPDDPLVHACALTYLSDTRTGSGPIMVAGGSYADYQMTSLDHAIWFHRPVRADGWLLFDSTPLAISGGRALGITTVHAAGGAMVATISQELLMRTPRGSAAHRPPAAP